MDRQELMCFVSKAQAEEEARKEAEAERHDFFSAPKRLAVESEEGVFGTAPAWSGTRFTRTQPDASLGVKRRYNAGARGGAHDGALFGAAAWGGAGGEGGGAAAAGGGAGEGGGGGQGGAAGGGAWGEGAMAALSYVGDGGGGGGGAAPLRTHTVSYNAADTSLRGGGQYLSGGSPGDPSPHDSLPPPASYWDDMERIP